MPKYQFILTPLEPYFLGTEREFAYGDQTKNQQRAGKYHIESEKIPSQSTLLGMLRFLLLGNLKKEDFFYEKEELAKIKKRIGKKSFELSDEKWDFGSIEFISPLFITKDQNDLMIPLPLNHKNGLEEYTSLEFDPKTKIETNSGIKYLPVNFNAKEGLPENAYLSLRDNKIDYTLFKEVTRIGIKTGGEDKSFFRKTYCQLKKGSSFTFFADLNPVNLGAETCSFLENEEKSDIVYLGKGKSAFKLQVKSGDAKINLDETVQKFLEAKNNIEDDWAYALGDTLVDSSIYESCYFVSSQTREIRTMKTKYISGSSNLRFKKTEELYTMIKAGSFFILRDINAFKEAVEENKVLQNMGWNKMICKEKKESNK